MKDTLQKNILDALASKQFLTVDQLSDELEVSPSTIRRHLTELQNKGLLKRTHGGASIVGQKNLFPSFTFRSHQNSLEKKKIALSALKLIKNGDVVFLDGSTSAYFMAEYLSEFSGIRVITNGIDTLSVLSRCGVKAYSTGGIVSETNRSVLVGNHAEKMIESLHANVTFFSAQSITADGEIYDCFEEENVLRKKMIERSDVSVLLCDNAKLNRTSPFLLLSVNQVDYLISDADLNNYFIKPTNVKIIKT